jgi:hypothetical protein
VYPDGCGALNVTGAMARGVCNPRVAELNIDALE